MVEGACLESRCTLSGTGGSNPSLSVVTKAERVGFPRDAGWRDAREAEGARLEIVRTVRYRGFESLSLRNASFGAAGPCATAGCEPRQARKGAAVASSSV